MASGLFTLKQQEIALGLNSWSGQKTPAVDYLVVAGGGGGAYTGGGGAGGLLQGTIAVTPGTAITVTVGGGGNGGTGGSDNATAGSNSVFGSITTIGGGAGRGNYVATLSTQEGGSGGGIGINGHFFGRGVLGQGNPGGIGNSSNAGGGGGAGGPGLSATGYSGDGGAGVASDIEGPRKTYAGGGGGAFANSVNTNKGRGGVGGGGAGGDPLNGVNGTANTGGGGGGASYTAPSVGTGGNGGSGIVVISYPDIYPAPTATTGSPTVSTSGSGAISFSGSSQYLQYADNAAFDVGSGDFTIEAWVYRTTTGRMYICGQSDSAGSNASQSFGFQINASNQLDGYIASGSTFYNATAATTFPSSTWTHVAFVRDGNTTRIYSGGVQVGTASVTGITANNSSNRLGIGSAGEYVAGVLWNGYITNLRIVKGTCLYPSGTTFTPSTTPLTAISGTSILLSAMSGAFSADASTNAFFPAALGNAPTWVDSSPFSVTGYKNRVYKWTASGSITF